MIWWILVGVAVVVWMVASYNFVHNEGEGAVSGIGLGFMVGGMSLAILFVAVIMPLSFTQEETHWDTTHSVHQVVALQDNFGIQGEVDGNLFFISGNIGTHQFFSWYEKAPDGSYTPNHANEAYSSVRIFEIGRKASPRVLKVVRTPHSTIPSWVAPFNVGNSDSYTQTFWTLYVPKGTIIQTSRLDNR